MLLNYKKIKINLNVFSSDHPKVKVTEKKLVQTF